MWKKRGRPAELDRESREAVVLFLQGWLTDEAKRVYREMIEEDPENWSRHPHFHGGVIVEHALRGNGIDERALGVADLDPLWPDLLRDAVSERESDA